MAMLRMLAAKPECILLDEPFSALDEHVKRSMESELMEMLTDFNNPVVFVSHNRDEVYRLAGRIGSMERGVLSTVRDKKDFFMRPMSVEQALLVGCNNISEVKWQDKHHLLAVEWDSVFEVTDEQLEQTAMSMDGISHIGVFPQDIICLLYTSSNETDGERHCEAAESGAFGGTASKMHPSPVKEGKIEVIADCDGLLKVDSEKLKKVNSFGEMMIATRHGNTTVKKGDKLAGTRIIPLVIKKDKLKEASNICDDGPIPVSYTHLDVYKRQV